MRDNKNGKVKKIKEVLLFFVLPLIFIIIIGTLEYTMNNVRNRRNADFLIENEIRDALTSEIKKMDDCTVNFYEIEYIDEINVNRCYVIKNTTLTGRDAFLLNESFKYFNIIKTEYFFEYLLKPNITCGSFQIIDKIWCTRNNLTCLKLEDNDRICNIINVAS